MTRIASKAKSGKKASNGRAPTNGRAKATPRSGAKAGAGPARRATKVKAGGSANGKRSSRPNGSGPNAEEVTSLVDERIAEGFGVASNEPREAAARTVATKLGHAMLAANSLDTAEHSDDVVLIAEAIGDRLGVDAELAADIKAAARLHDIGKASIPREILDKPGPLTPGEWALMREHTIIGERILAAVPELEGIAGLVRHSHERWDGEGYPDGLAGDEIPLGSRIVFCADAFHAIRSNRPYRNGRRAPDALAEIKRCSASQFDPQVVAALERVAEDLRLVPASRRNGSRRLATLLMMLALGAGSSAMAESDLLGSSEDSRAGAPAAGALPDCGPIGCPPLLGVSIFEQIRGGNESGRSLTPSGAVDPDGGSPPDGVPEDKNPDANGNGWAYGHTDKNPDANGRGWAKGQAQQGGDESKDKNPEANGNGNAYGNENGNGGSQPSSKVGGGQGSGGNGNSKK